MGDNMMVAFGMTKIIFNAVDDVFVNSKIEKKYFNNDNFKIKLKHKKICSTFIFEHEGKEYDIDKNAVCIYSNEMCTHEVIGPIHSSDDSEKKISFFEALEKYKEKLFSNTTLFFIISIFEDRKIQIFVEKYPNNDLKIKAQILNSIKNDLINIHKVSEETISVLQNSIEFMVNDNGNNNVS